MTRCGVAGNPDGAFGLPRSSSCLGTGAVEEEDGWFWCWWGPVEPVVEAKGADIVFSALAAFYYWKQAEEGCGGARWDRLVTTTYAELVG